MKKPNVKPICDEVEDIMQLEVDSSFKSGLTKFTEVSLDGFLKYWEKESIDSSTPELKAKVEEAFGFYKKLKITNFVEMLRNEMPNTKHWPKKREFLKELGRIFVLSQSVLGYYVPGENNFCIIKQNIEKVSKALVVSNIAADEDELFESVIVHELAHKTHGDHYPKLFESFKSQCKEISALEFKLDSSSSFSDTFCLWREIKKLNDTSFGAHAYIEGVGQYVQEEFGKRSGKDVMGQMENAKLFWQKGIEQFVIRVLEIKDKMESYEKGCKFLRHIEEKTKKNPLVFTYGKPPLNREEIENPWKYLRRI